MSNASKNKGTRAETKVVRYLEAHGISARRQALSGSDDQGDIEAMRPGSGSRIIIEVKAGKQTAAPNRTQIEEWCRQAITEMCNAGADMCVVIVVRYNRSLDDADVYVPYRNCRMHWYLSDWVELE